MSLSRNHTLPVFNEARISAFSMSANCPEKYRGMPARDLWNLMDREDLYVAYGFYVHMTWLMERGRRRSESRRLSGVQLLQSRIRYAEAVSAAPVPVKPLQDVRPVRSYARLFADTVDKGEWSPVELEVRKMFIEELEKAKLSGGCTGCKRSRLVAKYVEKVRLLTESR